MPPRASPTSASTGPERRRSRGAESVLEARREALEVGRPDPAEDRHREARADLAAQPPGEAQLLAPAEAGPALERRPQREAPDPGDRAAVLDPHDRARLPLGDLELVSHRQRPDPRAAGERGADATTLVAREADVFGVGHPRGMGGEILDPGPDRSRRGCHRRADGDDAHCASRSITAACSGGTVLTRMPVPISKPATVAMRGVTSTYQWKLPARPGGAVCTTRL